MPVPSWSGRGNWGFVNGPKPICRAQPAAKRSRYLSSESTMNSSTDQSMLKIPASSLAAMHRAARQLSSPAEAAALVRQIGYESGEGFLSEFTAWLMHHRHDPGAAPSDLSADEFWHLLSAFFARIGWGRLHFEQLHEG